MPNLCFNRLSVSGDDATLAAFTDAMGGAYPPELVAAGWPAGRVALCFHALHAVPAGVLRLGVDATEAWIETNWGAFLCPDALLPRDEGGIDMVDVSFDTAWEPPLALIDHVVRRFPTLDVLLAYVEPNMGFCGHYGREDGRPVDWRSSKGVDVSHVAREDVGWYPDDDEEDDEDDEVEEEDLAEEPEHDWGPHP